MIGNLWFALLAFVLGAGLTYLRMAGSATRRVAKPVPHRLVMGGIIPGVVDAPAESLPAEIGPEWQIRIGGAMPEETPASVEVSPAGQEASVGTEATAPESIEAAADAEATGKVENPTDAEGDAAPAAPEPDPAEPDPTAAVADQDVAHSRSTDQTAGQPDDASTPPGSTEPTPEPSEPLHRQIAAGATTEPPTSSWWAAAFDRGDPGPYPGPLRYSSGWPPAGSRVLDVDDEFAAALGAGAAASAASAALFGTAGRSATEPEPVRPAPTRASAQSPRIPSTPTDAGTATSADPGEELIKGNRDSMLYHTPDSPWYARTNAEELFHTEDEAQAAGFSRWNSRTDKQRD